MHFRTSTLATTLFLFAACKSSILGEIKKHPDQFPPPYASVAPISQGSRGGAMGTVHDDRFVPDATTCFEETRIVSNPGTAVSATYGRKGKAKAELQIIAASIKKTLGDVGINANVTFDKSAQFSTGPLSNETIFLVPNPLGECRFEDPNQRYNVVRQQIRASDLSLSSKMTVTTDLGVKVPIEKLIETTAGTDWAFTREGSVTGKDVVVAVKSEIVQVDIQRETKSSRPDPLIGVDLVKSLGFENPLLRDVKLTFIGASMPEPNRPKIKLLPSSSMPFTGIQSERLAKNICTMGQEKELGVGEDCYFVPMPGNVLISFGWSKGIDPTTGGDTIEVSITSFKTYVPGV